LNLLCMHQTCKYKAEGKFERYKTLEIHSPSLWKILHL
jgi:hypothetical protein